MDSNQIQNLSQSLNTSNIIQQSVDKAKEDVAKSVDKIQQGVSQGIDTVEDKISDMYNYTSENKINYSTFLITMISLIIAYIVKITGGMDEKFILYFIYIFIIIYVLWNFFKDMFLSCYN